MSNRSASAVVFAVLSAVILGLTVVVWRVGANYQQALFIKDESIKGHKATIAKLSLESGLKSTRIEALEWMLGQGATFPASDCDKPEPPRDYPAFQRKGDTWGQNHGGAVPFTTGFDGDWTRCFDRDGNPDLCWELSGGVSDRLVIGPTP